VEALQSGRLSGAALDVTSPEPLPLDHPLLEMSNVILTPHAGWYSETALWDLRRSIVEDVLALSAGRLPASIVNPSVIESADFRMQGAG
jgi:D-3-phosphoglycerate dehydrogenase